MNRRCFVSTLVGATALTGITWHRCTTSRKPNFLFILVDDLGWADLGCYGSTFHETPNLDGLAATGMRFTDAYAACPVCSPTRAAIMTGRHPVRLNITDWIPGDDPHDRERIGPQDQHELPHAEVTIAEMLRDNGYRTFLAGKWHLGGEGYYPEDQGFDINKGGHEMGHPSSYYSPYRNPKLADGPEGEYLTDRLTDESIQFLKEAGEEPFFLYLPFYTVHTPIQACKRHLQHFQEKAASLTAAMPDEREEHAGATKLRQDDAAYATMVYAMDENIGRLLRSLEELELAERTIVIFTSDNGGLSTMARNRRAPTSNEPLRAGKGWCYEGGIRVPLIVRAPGISRVASICCEPVISMDFFPTMLELAGLTVLPEKHIDGLSLVPLLRGAEQLPRDALYWHYPHYHSSTWTPGAALRARDWKLIEFFDEEKVELYNLKEDIGEKNDLASTLPGRRDELLAELHRWQRELDAKMPTLNQNTEES
ncbi:sulfatase [candidate division KSB1 bacterium]|nr:sulfatase [candidate division KSB1 bacterium]RQW04634.1 MAG: DUF4976 domain-containing protein [candidate division KSB1 bacterium]